MFQLLQLIACVVLSMCGIAFFFGVIIFVRNLLRPNQATTAANEAAHESGRSSRRVAAQEPAAEALPALPSAPKPQPSGPDMPVEAELSKPAYRQEPGAVAALSRWDRFNDEYFRSLHEKPRRRRRKPDTSAASEGTEVPPPNDRDVLLPAGANNS